MNERSTRIMDALTARALLFQRKLTIKNVDWSIPGVEALDNQLAVLELTEDALQQCSKFAEQPNGSINPAIAGAASICKSLVLRESKERILQDNDIEAVAKWGHSILKPLGDLVEEVSALSADAIANAKKNLPIIPVSDSGSLSPANLEAVSQ